MAQLTSTDYKTRKSRRIFKTTNGKYVTVTSGGNMNYHPIADAKNVPGSSYTRPIGPKAKLPKQIRPSKK